MSCVKSLHVPNFLGFARYSHLKGFTEFTGFYIKDFSLSTQFSKSVVYTVPPPEDTYYYLILL